MVRFSRKIIFALIMATRKLQSYFQAHPTMVLLDQPLKDMLGKVDIFGRMIKWSVKLSEFALEYSSRKVIQLHTLADFVVECSFS
ncbi:hypothetical protein ES332_D02G079700v1 [Gossypium tomentosum]|uniref:Reverse transcriptase RNase H-like domain-containing protein n=1 Tax=Gossypium tomentosum TaxID=34277 RepID=A0A5D2LUH2_GOSTO|nr:hypothetical protein ES332_D02G079700v1 [Gossypium tomentosum]